MSIHLCPIRTHSLTLLEGTPIFGTFLKIFHGEPLGHIMFLAIWEPGWGWSTLEFLKTVFREASTTTKLRNVSLVFKESPVLEESGLRSLPRSRW
jgi:hypothetical protein